MAPRNYGQYCGIARAMEMVGERWGLLIVRDLVLGPKRFVDLRRGLPRIPTNILSARLKELEQYGIVRRRVLPRPGSGVVYELTDYGAELEDIVLRFGRWGARSLGMPGPDDIITLDALILALRATFQPDAAQDVEATFQLNVGPVHVYAVVDRGALDVEEGDAAGPTVVIEVRGPLKALLAGEMSPADAIESGVVLLTGDASLLDRFVQVFRLDPTPVIGEVGV